MIQFADIKLHHYIVEEVEQWENEAWMKVIYLEPTRNLLQTLMHYALHKHVAEIHAHEHTDMKTAVISCFSIINGDVEIYFDKVT